MFEGLVSDILTQYLGDYVVGLADKERLKLAIWRGDLTLENLQLRRDALDKLRLPVQVKSGYIGELKLKVPWASLRSQPVVLTVKRVYLLVGPPNTDERNREEDEATAREVAQKLKRAKLNAAELFRTKGLNDEKNPNNKQQDSFYSRLYNKIIDNVQIDISDVVLRYEEPIPNKEEVYVMGFMLDGAFAQSCNEDWEPCFVDRSTGDNKNLVHKILELRSFCSFCEPGAASFHCEDQMAMVEKFEEMIASHKDLSHHGLVFQPLTINLRLTLNSGEALRKGDKPKVQVKANIESIEMVLLDEQYTHVVKMLQLFNKYAEHEWHLRRTHARRPKIPVLQDPKAWWAYAINVHVEEIHARRYRQTGEYLLERRVDRLAYTKLYMKKEHGKKGTKLTPEETTELDALEEKLSVEDIIFFRSCADMEKRKVDQRQKQGEQQGGWMNWVWGWGGSKDPKAQQPSGSPQSSPVKKPATAEKDPESMSEGELDESVSSVPEAADPAKGYFSETQLTDAEREELYRIIEYRPQEDDEDEAVSPEYVKMRARFTLGVVDFTFSKKLPNGDTSRIIRMTVNKLMLGVSARQETLSIMSRLQSIHVQDCIKDTQFPELLRMQDKAPVDGDEEPEDMYLLSVNFENNPLDKRADMVLELELAPLEIVWNRVVYQEMEAFLKSAEPVDVENLKKFTQEQMESLKESAQIQLRDALGSHKTIELKVDADAPKIVIPEDPCMKDGIIMVLDFGHMEVVSDLSNKEKRKMIEEEIRQRRRSRATSNIMRDVHRSDTGGEEGVISKEEIQTEFNVDANEVIYDTFNFVFSEMQVIITTSDNDWRVNSKNQANPGDERRMHVIDRFRFLLTLQNSIIPASSIHPGIRLHGQLESLRLNLSSTSWKRLSKLLNYVIHKPKDGEGDAAPDVVSSTVEYAEAVGQQVFQAFQTKGVQTKLVEGFFEVPTIEFVLEEDEPGLPIVPVVDIVVRGIAIDYVQRPYDIFIKARLHGIVIEDKFVKHENAVTCIASSRPSKSRDDDLIHVEYKYIQQVSPEYENVDSFLLLKFRSLDIEWNHVTIKRFFGTLWAGLDIMTFDPYENVPESTVESTSRASRLSSAQSQRAQKSKSSKAPHQKLSCTIDLDGSLRLSLNEEEDGKKLALFQVTGGHMLYTMFEDTFEISGWLGNMSVIHLDMPEGGKHFKIFGLRGNEKSLFEFRYRTYRMQDPDYPGWDKYCMLHFSSVEFIMIWDVFCEILSYLGNKCSGAFARPEKPGAVQDAAEDDVTRLKWDFKAVGPRIVLPECDTSYNKLTFELSQLSYTNVFHEADEDPARPNSWADSKMTMEKTHLFASFGDKEVDVIRKILDDVDITLNFDSPECASDLPKSFPRTKISGLFAEVMISLSQKEYQLLMDVWYKNLSYRRPPPRDRAISGASALSKEETVNKKRASSSHHSFQTAVGDDDSSNSKSLSKPRMSVLDIEDDLQSGAMTPVTPSRTPGKGPRGSGLTEEKLKAVHEADELVLTGTTDQTDEDAEEAQLNTSWSLQFEHMQMTILRDEGQLLDSVASFHVNGFHFSMDSFSDGIMQLEVRLFAMDLYDMRPETTSRYPKLLTFNQISSPANRRATAESRSAAASAHNPEEPLFRVQYISSRKNQKTIILHMENPTGIVVADAVFDIVGFFNAPRPEDGADGGVVELDSAEGPTEDMLHRRKTMSETFDRVKSLADGEQHPSDSDMFRTLEAVGEDALETFDELMAAREANLQKIDDIIETMGETKITINIKNVEIRIPENSDRTDTRALVLRSNLFLDYYSDKKHQLRINGSTEALEVFVSTPNVNDTKVPIVLPFDMSVSLSKEQHDQVQLINEEGDTIKQVVWRRHLKIDILKTVSGRFSYLDFCLVMAIAENFAKTEKNAEPQPEGTSAPSKSDLRTPVEGSNIVLSKYTSDFPAEAGREGEGVAAQLLKDKGPEVVQTEAKEPARRPTSAATEEVKELVMDEQIVVQSEGFHVTLINDCQGRNMPLGTVNVSHMMATFRGRAMEMKGSVDFAVSMYYHNDNVLAWEPVVEPWSCQLYMERALVDKNVYTTTLTLRSNSILNLNMTDSCINTALKTMNVVRQDREESAKPSAIYSPYWVKNFAGVPVTVTYEEEAVEIEPGREVPFSLGSDKELLHKADKQTRRIAIGVHGGWLPLRSVPVDRVDVHQYKLTPEKGVVDKDTMGVVKVDMRDDSKVVTITSMVMLENRTDIDIEIKVESAYGREPFLDVLAAQSSLPVPVALVSGGILRVRPVRDGDGHNYTWTDNVECVFLSDVIAGREMVRRMKRDDEFWRHFSDLPDEDFIIADFSCQQIQRGTNLNGRLFITPRHMCFFSRATLFSGQVSLTVKYFEIDTLQKVQGMFLPAIRVSTAKGTYTFGSVSSRDEIYELVSRLRGGMRVVGREDHPDSVAHILTSSCMRADKLPYRFCLTKRDIDCTVDPGEIPAVVKRSKGCPTIISFTAPMLLENLLPCSLTYRIEDECEPRKKGRLEEGKMAHVFKAHAGRNLFIRVKIENYAWSQPLWVNGPVSNLADGLQLKEKDGRILRLSVEAVRAAGGILRLVIFCPYWIVNKTGMRLLYRQANDNSNAAHQYDQTASDALSLFSYNKYDPFGNKMVLKVSASTWSSPLSLESAGTQQGLTIDDEAIANQPTRKYEIGVDIALGPGKFNRTRVVTCSPRFILANMIEDEVIYVQQRDTGIAKVMCSGVLLPFHWPDGSRRQLLSLRFDDDGWEWSGGFAIDEAGDFPVKVRHQDRRSFRLVRVQIKVDGATVYIQFRSENTELPTYRIENNSETKIFICQKGLKMIDCINPHQSIPYAWDEPSMDHTLLMEAEKTNIVQSYSLDEIKNYSVLRLKDEYGRRTEPLSVRVYAKGPTKVLCIEDRRANEARVRAAKLAEDKVLKYEFCLNIPGMGLSIVDRQPRELAYVSVERLYARFRDTNLDQALEVKIQNVQIDNQMLDTTFPVLMIPSARDHRTPFINLCAIKDRSEKHRSIDYFNYVAFLVQEADVYLDEEFVRAIMKFLGSIRVLLGEEPEDIDVHNYVNSLRDPLVVPESTPQLTKKVYFDVLELHPFKITVSFYRKTADLEWSDDPLRMITGAINVAFTNIDHAPLRLGAVKMRHVFETREALVDRMYTHYKGQLLREVFQVLGSVEILGNPVGLVKSLGTGAWDFFYDPAKGLVKGPEEFVEGLGKGTKSLVKNTVYGTSNAAEKFTGSVSRGLAALTMDQQYVRDRAIEATDQPTDIVEGFSSGMKGLVKGTIGGVTGLVTAPIEGVSRDGLGGLLRGTVKGVGGLVIKPTAGLFDFANKTAVGIRSSATSSNAERMRVRYPRCFGVDKVMKVYDYQHAVFQALLYSLERGKYREDTLAAYENVENQQVVIITEKRVMLVRLLKEEEVWELPLRSILRVDLQDDQIVLFINPSSASSQGHEKQVKTIPCSNKQHMIQLYEKISDAASKAY